MWWTLVHHQEFLWWDFCLISVEYYCFHGIIWYMVYIIWLWWCMVYYVVYVVWYIWYMGSDPIEMDKILPHDFFSRKVFGNVMRMYIIEKKNLVAQNWDEKKCVEKPYKTDKCVANYELSKCVRKMRLICVWLTSPLVT